MVEAAAAEEALARAWVRGDQPLNTVVDDARSFSANTAAARWLPPTSLSRQLTVCHSVCVTVCHSGVSRCATHSPAMSAHEPLAAATRTPPLRGAPSSRVPRCL